MSDEVEVVAETPAPVEDATAAPSTEETQAPEDSPKGEESKAEVKTFTQEELDAAIGKRLAREQRKWEREQAQRLAEVQSQPSQADIRQDQFETPEAYAEALAERKARELIQQREEKRQQLELAEAYSEREEEARTKYDDFEQVAYNPRLPITDVMAETIKASDVGPDVAYYLGSNPKEADRISRLSPFMQAKEIGKIEAKLASDPVPVKKTSAAPAPISPVTARGASSPSFDTTDPRSVKSMSTAEWIAAENARLRKKLEQRNR